MTDDELVEIIKIYTEKTVSRIVDPIKSQLDSSLSDEDLVERLAKLMPSPKNGVDGNNGKDGVNGKNGKDGDAPGIDAVASAVSSQFERRFSDLVLSWERQARDSFERAVDKMPVPVDGKDGLPADAIEIEQDGRDVTITVGQTVKKIALDTVLDQGVWREGEYRKGDAVTYGGSLWIAQKTTDDAPGTSKGWRLAVKKGRDGKDLRDSASKHDKAKGVEL